MKWLGMRGVIWCVGEDVIHFLVFRKKKCEGLTCAGGCGAWGQGSGWMNLGKWVMRGNSDFTQCGRSKQRSVGEVGRVYRVLVGEVVVGKEGVIVW